MEGYDVITTEDEKVGKVVGTHGDHLVVEQGTLRKSKHLLPSTFAEVDDSQQIVRASVTKDIISDSPTVNGDVDERAVLEHYGLAGGYEAPPTEGYGDSVPDDPAIGAEQQAERAGMPTATEQRVESREQLGRETDQGVPAESPALLGDRYEHTKDES
jgi:hypothetical protein